LGGESAAAEIPSDPRANRRAFLIAGEAVLLAAALTAAVLGTEASDWRPFDLFASLLVLAVAGQFLSVRTGSVRIGPAFISTALAMALLGPAPAAVIAVAAVLAWSLKSPTSRELAFNNVVALTVYPVAGALLFEALGAPALGASTVFTVAATVFAVYLLTNFLNFLLIVGYLCVRDRTRLREAFVRLYLPVVPWEVATGALTAGTVLAYQEVGLVAIALLAVMLVTSRYLLQAVVDAQRQRDELQAQMEELEALHHGVVRVMVETLGMRDRMTARHSAAVARFAKATARAAGLPAREQELVHTAGLLHDVGKFTFPDHTLTSRHLTDEDWELIRSHPRRGADIVGRVHGYGDVAEIILCHHERVDGAGYPRNLTGDDIPLLARILSVADCFDVMTARDSYRTPIPVETALEELRRVAGTQLDARMVEVVIGVVKESGVDFSHRDDEDLEFELRTRIPQPPARVGAHVEASRR
jgi:putative nucleotidyltransferase with HDIG domain